VQSPPFIEKSVKIINLTECKNLKEKEHEYLKFIEYCRFWHQQMQEARNQHDKHKKN